MKLRILLLALLTSAIVSAQEPWLQLYYPNGTQYSQTDMSEILDITFDETTSLMTIHNSDGTSRSVSMTSLEKFRIAPPVPRIDVTTDEAVDEIPSKEYYLTGKATFRGFGVYDDVIDAPLKIRGRGNSTWSYSKKPYRLKFDEKQKLGNIHKARNFAVLANYLDASMMRNFVAFAFGKVIGMPWINRSLPVDFYLNGLYKGSYQLTEKCGINNGSVDLTKEEEAQACMFELDTYTPADDERYFTSSYGFPVLYHDPDAPLDTNGDADEDWYTKWQDEFEDLTAVTATADAAQIFDKVNMETLIKYVMVYDICCNQELNHPKSTFLYKIEGQKWEFGPCWDFDWAFGYEPTYSKGTSGNSWGGGHGGWGGGGWGTSYETYENPLFGKGSSSNQGGNLFFYDMVKNTTFLTAFRAAWDDFYQNHRQEFWDAFDAYADQLEPSANLQGVTRSSYQNYRTNVETLRQWVENRIEYINSDTTYSGLFDALTED